MERRTDTRRRFLQATGLGAIVTLAGCTDATGENSVESTTGDPVSETTETETTETETTADSRDMKAVLHFSGTPDRQNHAIANVENLLADDSTPVASTALVANGAGVSLLTTESEDPKAVEDLASRGVSLLACQNSLRAKGLTDDDLLAGVETVPAGVGELVERQTDGFAYVKVP